MNAKRVTAMGFTMGVILAMLPVSAAMAADPPIGSRLGNRMRPSNDQFTIEAAALRGHQLATCLANKRTRAVQRLLQQQTEASYAKAYRDLMSDELTCYTGMDNEFVEARTFAIPRPILRGLLAERLILKNALAVTTLAALPLQNIYARPWFAVTSRNLVVDEMGACIAATAPAPALAVLRTRPYSIEEKAGFAALGPQFGVCLRSGTKLLANRQEMRAAVADALYQRTIESAPLASGVTK